MFVFKFFEEKVLFEIVDYLFEISEVLLELIEGRVLLV